LPRLIAGGLDKLQRRPFIGFISSITSPLKISSDHTEYIMEVARYGLPLATSTAPAGGSNSAGYPGRHTGPAECRGFDGCYAYPVGQSGHPGSLQRRTGNYGYAHNVFLMGSIESGLMNAAITQMAHYYRLPCYITVGTTDSKLPDAQAAHESASTAMLAALAGGNFIHEAFGMLDGAMTVSYAQYVIDNDIVGSCLRTLRGIEINRDTLAFDVIASVGPGGNYLSEEHTVKYMRTESYIPRASDRQQYQHWIDAGSKDSWKKAEEIAAQLLEEPSEEIVPAEIDAEIRAQFPELVEVLNE
jgi:trimethylamine---corrinoid protein Co-methyltransferase